MKFIKLNIAPIILLTALFALSACKAKKLIQKPEPPVAETTQPATPVQPAPKPAPVTPAPVEKPDFNFSNIQFDFNSSVLKTDSYSILDKVVSEMKADPTAKLILNGYASIEGTPEHNMILSQDRANSVKTYLANAGVNAGNLVSKGYGTSNPVADNNIETGRVLNRRVEIKTQDQ